MLALLPRRLASRGAPPARRLAAGAPAGAPADAAEAAAAELDAAFAVRPGALLRVALGVLRADVVVTCGADAEEVRLSAAGAGAAAAAASFDAAAGVVALAARPGAPPGAPLAVAAAIPARYVGVDLETGGGAVRVEGVKEAARAAVRSRGGAVTFGRLAAARIFIDSAGGAVEGGGLTAADVRVDSRGGAVRLGSIAGTSAALDAGGGAVELGAVYADALDVRDAGGFAAAALQCGAARVAVAPGGTVAIGGLDGALQLRAPGAAAVRLQLNDGARRVDVDAGAGADVELCLSPGLAVDLELRGGLAGRLELPPERARAMPAAPGGGARAEVLALEAGGAPRSRLQRGEAKAPRAAVTVHGAAAVRVRRRSWMEGVEEDVASRAATAGARRA
jgi:hypothetical protein